MLLVCKYNLRTILKALLQLKMSDRLKIYMIRLEYKLFIPETKF